eukprot:3792756-Pyramimonas_sp.AAC.1
MQKFPSLATRLSQEWALPWLSVDSCDKAPGLWSTVRLEETVNSFSPLFIILESCNGANLISGY